MLELLHAHFNFLCRATRQNKEGLSPILLRIVYRKERRDHYTGLYANPKDWNSSGSRVAGKSPTTINTNRNLELIMHKAWQVLDDLRYSGVPFTIDELSDQIRGKEARPRTLMEFLKERHAEIARKKGIDICAATVEKYLRITDQVLDYLQTVHKIKNYPLARLDKKFLEQYFFYLRDTRGISHNTAVKYFTALKTMLMPAITEGIIRQDPFQKIKLKTKAVYPGFLTEEELKKLRDKEYDSKDQTRIRDIFLFCCFTGLSYIDLKQLNTSHILQQTDGSFYIMKPRQKTGQQCIIPLIPAAIEILKKYSPSADFRDFKWHVSTNQKMNQRLKDIGELAEINKPLHMHLARHTFATTVTLSNGVPIETVSSMLGHSTLGQTQHYAKIVSMKVMKDMGLLSSKYV